MAINGRQVCNRWTVTCENQYGNIVPVSIGCTALPGAPIDGLYLMVDGHQYRVPMDTAEFLAAEIMRRVGRLGEVP